MAENQEKTMASNDKQDKLLMETCIKHLIQYAATIKISREHKGMRASDG